MRKQMLLSGLLLTVLALVFLVVGHAAIVAQNTFSLSLDANSAAGDQAVTSVNTSADQDVSIQVFGSSIQNANSFGLRFEYDASQVTYQGFDAGSVLPGSPQVLAQQGTNPTSVEIGIASLGSQTTVSSGLVGTIRFRTIAGFSGTSIRLVHAQLSRGGQSETVTLTARVELGVSTAPSVDFDGDGTVGIPDFLLFVNHFGTSSGDAGYDARYDLDGNGAIGIPDFLIFVNSFGSQVPPSGGGGGGGSSSPDLIVESPSVSDNTLTTGQSFTLSATVRNQGTGSSASTTLRYYRSSDATISASDTEVGTDAVGSLNASGTSAESISLNAPSSAGTYYYGACVESISGESDTDNNCSTGVQVTVQAAADDHSNTRSGATSLSLGSSRSGQIETGSDADYFRVQVTGSGTLTVYTTGSLDTTGELQSSSGSVLSSNDDGGSGSNFRIERSVSAGTYYIKVEGYRSSTGSYTVHASFGSGSSSGSGSLGQCQSGMVVSPNQSCTVSGGEFRNIGGGCYMYTPFGSGRFCSGSFFLNGLRGTRVGTDFRIDAVP